jgi:hypothetical protein
MDSLTVYLVVWVGTTLVFLFALGRRMAGSRRAATDGRLSTAEKGATVAALIVAAVVLAQTEEAARRGGSAVEAARVLMYLSSVLSMGGVLLLFDGARSRPGLR